VFLSGIARATGPVVVRSVINSGTGFSSTAVVQEVEADTALSPWAVFFKDEWSEAVGAGCGLVFLCGSLI